jgi:hypothetical protein
MGRLGQRTGESSMNPRKIKIRLHDTTIGIQQDDPNDPSFRTEIYGGLICAMRKRGWSVREDPHIKRNYSSLNPNHRLAAKGPLRASVETMGRSAEIKIWSVNAVQENRNGRRFDFDKLDRMPFLDQKRFHLESTRLTDWLKERCEATVTHGREKGLTADQRIAKNYAASWHSDKELGRPICRSDGNRKSADGTLIEHGQIVWFAGYDGRIRRGQAFYNINNMWWVKVSRNELRNIACFELFTQAPEDLRRKRNERRRRQRLEALLTDAVRRSDYLRAGELQRILFGTEQVYRIWSRKKDAFYSSNCSGYTSDGISAGRYTRAEAEAEVRRVPHILSLVTPDGKHVRFDEAA